jgi:hypothetical protein
MKDVTDKTSDLILTQDDINSIATELENLVKSGGFNLSGADSFQSGKALATYVASGHYFDDTSSTAGTFTLQGINFSGVGISRQVPQFYSDGMEVVFEAANASTAAPGSINVVGIGAKNLTLPGGGSLTVDTIAAGDLVRATYKVSSDRFELYRIPRTRLDIGDLDCSTNPNYPAAEVGHIYDITIAGKIGGASGFEVLSGYSIVCTTDSAAGDHATVGANWKIIFGPSKQYLGDGTDFTVTGTNWTTTRAVAIPYQTADGSWKLWFQIYGGISVAVASITLTISGVTFKTGTFGVTPSYQLSGGATYTLFARANSATGTLSLQYSAATVDSLIVFGDVELDSKPTFAG